MSDSWKKDAGWNSFNCPLFIPSFMHTIYTIGTGGSNCKCGSLRGLALSSPWLFLCESSYPASALFRLSHISGFRWPVIAGHHRVLEAGVNLHRAFATSSLWMASMVLKDFVPFILADIPAARYSFHGWCEAGMLHSVSAHSGLEYSAGTPGAVGSFLGSAPRLAWPLHCGRGGSTTGRPALLLHFLPPHLK